MTFLLGFFIGSAIGIAGAALLLKVGGSRDLEILRAEVAAKTLVLRNGAATAHRSGNHVLGRYLEHILDDEAGA